MGNIFQELIVPLSLDDSKYTGGLDNAIKSGSFFGSFWGNLASNILSGAVDLVGKGIGFVTSGLKDMVGEAMSGQEALSQLEAVIKSTGGKAGVTSEKAQELAASFQKLTRFSDEQILSGESMLLTFTSIGQDVFPRATETILNMSQALGQDLNASAIQLGKALNMPVEGVTALRRVGVQFTDDQEKMIKSLVDSGHLLEAQTMILDELQVEFGGSAVAAGQTFGGQLDILKNKVSDIKERIAGSFMPVLTDLATRFSTLIDSPQVQALIDKAVAGLGQLSDWIITNLPVWIKSFEDWWGQVKKSGLTITDIWNNSISPAGRELKKTMDLIFDILNKLSPSTEGTANKFTLLGATQRILLGGLSALNVGFQIALGILQVINNVINSAVYFWNRLQSSIAAVRNTLAGLSIPSWLTPGSPTPLEMGLRGINNALSDLNKGSLSGFSANLGFSNAAPAMASGGGFSRIDPEDVRMLAIEIGKVVG